jgi:hypothetical protein
MLTATRFRRGVIGRTRAVALPGGGKDEKLWVSESCFDMDDRDRSHCRKGRVREMSPPPGDEDTHALIGAKIKFKSFRNDWAKHLEGDHALREDAGSQHAAPRTAI